MGRGRCPEGVGREMGKALAGLWWSPMTTRLSVIGQACALPMQAGPSLDTWFTAQQLLDLGQVRQANWQEWKGLGVLRDHHKDEKT